MAHDLFDLSSITDALVAVLDTAVKASPMWNTHGGPVPPFQVTVSGSAPETVRDADGGCQLCLYLMHIGRDPTFRNAPTVGERGLINTQQPLALVLSYLLTAYAGVDAIKEQQAMGIALRCLHDRTIYRPSAAEKATFNLPDDEYVLTMEVDTLEEMSRLWQSTTVSYRLSTIFRVSVALLAPLKPPPAPAPPPDRMGLAIAPAPGALSDPPLLLGPALRVDLTKSPAAQAPDDVAVAVAPEVAAAGQSVMVAGVGLDLPSAAQVYLTTLDGATTWKVTPWRKALPAPTPGGQLVLQLPAAYGAPPAATPPPGVYLMAVGADAPPSRSPAAPLAIGARIDGVTDPPALTPDGGGIYAVQGAGFTAGATQVFLDTVPLTPGGAPGVGVFAINPTGTRVSFRLPQPLDTGRYRIRVRVDGVESPPSWWIDAP